MKTEHKGRHGSEGRRRDHRPRELCTLGPDGKVSDAAIHEVLLHNPEADLLTRRASYRRAVADGVAPELAKLMYGQTQD